MASIRFWFRGSIVVLCVFAGLHSKVGMNAAYAATTTSWTQFQGDAGHTGYIPAMISQSAIQPLWTASATALGQSTLVLGAATDGQYVYTTGFNPTGRIYQVLALNPLTGSKTWSTSFIPVPNYPLSAPTTGNGMVYVDQTGESDAPPSERPYVYGLSSATGSIVFATTYSAQWGAGSRPTVADNQVFVPGGYFGGLNSYNALTGANQWFATVNQQYGWIPAADTSRVYLYLASGGGAPGPETGTFYAFNRSTGSLAFTIQNPDDKSELFNGTVFLGGQNDAVTLTSGSAGLTLVSFDLNQQAIRWRSAGNYSGSIAIDQGSIFADKSTELDVLNETTGLKTGSWLAPTGHNLRGNLLVTNNLIFAQTDQSTYAIDRNTLTAVWSTNTVGDLALGDGLLLISNANSVSAFTVPELSTLVLLCMGAFGFLTYGWRRRK